MIQVALPLRVTPAVFAILCSTGKIAVAQGSSRIRDNSFLIEEAYNQDPCEVQHIQTFQYMRHRTWAYVFTQEWPLRDEKNQISFTIPFLRPGSFAPGGGLGDVELNYRYQAVLKTRVAFAPRLSVLLPSGDYRQGYGNGAAGLQTSLPLSLELSEKWVTHWNAGLTAVPHSRASNGARAGTLGFNLGASAIRNVIKNADLMLEAVWQSSQSVEAAGSTRTSKTLLLNPGLRFALNVGSALQIVPGIAVPVGVGPSRGERGVFAYLSFEHKFCRKHGGR